MRAASWSRRLGTIPQWVVDTSLVALLPLLALVAFLIGTSTNLAADALAYGLGLLVALVLLVRRRAPRLAGWLTERLAAIPAWARATAVVVRIGYQPDGMVVEIGDNGRGAAAGRDGGGYGLIGMRERATAVGGRLEAGPAPSRGFTVRAWLPTPGRPG